jgi:SAM-dependent methyltransferase
VLIGLAAIAREPIHTLRELEEARWRAGNRSDPPAVVALRPGDRPPRAEETCDAYIERRLRESQADRSRASFPLFCVEVSQEERPEITSRLPQGKCDILDVGCGGGGAIGAARPSHRQWHVTGVEKDERLAQIARGRLDLVIEGDLHEVLPRLVSEERRFDALVFADVLEHLEDALPALEGARQLLSPGGRLVATVPNVGHLSVVRDLVLGRFDPVPAGLLDAGHLRWFTRDSFTELLAEAGWRIVEVAPLPGSPPPDAPEFLRRLDGWEEIDWISLGTYQWLAVGE